MLDKYIFKKILTKSKIYLLEYRLDNKNSLANTYFVKKNLKLSLNYKINFFPLSLIYFSTIKNLSLYLKKTFPINFVLVKINSLFIKNKIMFDKYIKNKFNIYMFFKILTQIQHFFFKVFNLK